MIGIGAINVRDVQHIIIPVILRVLIHYSDTSATSIVFASNFFCMNRHNSCLCDHTNLPSPDVSRRLPAELLASVFIYIARDSYIDLAPTGPSWANVSHVCRYWREVALNCPILWGYIPPTSQRWTEELLARSQMAPLKIRLGATGYHWHDDFDEEEAEELMFAQMLSIVEQVMNHSHRIQELRLDLGDVFGPEAHSQVLSKLLSTRLPCLQYLEMHRSFSFPERKSLSEENTPVLRTLSLQSGSVPWYALGSSVLTTLVLDHSPKDSDTMGDFLSMLRRMPHLVRLHVRNALPSARVSLFNGEFDATPTISLSRLSYISITMVPLTAVIALMSCVDIPLRTRVRLGPLVEYTIIEYVASICKSHYIYLAPFLAHRISQTDSSKYCSLFVGGPRNPRFSLSTSKRVKYHSPILQVVLSRTSPINELHYLLSRICREVPLTNIQSVHFLESSFETEFWRDILASLSNVRHIRFSECQISKIISMLSLPFPHLARSLQDGCVDRGQGEIFVPKLKELELCKTTLKRVRRGSDPNPHVADVQELYNAIATRKETRCRLTIKDCRLETDEGVENLEAVGWWEGDQFKVTSNV